MAGFGWNMRQQGNNNNVHELENNHGRKSQSIFPPTQIACRICNKVFFSTQSLINHIETHMVNYETAATRRQNELNNYQLANANPNFNNNFTLQTPLQAPQLPNPFLVPEPRILLNQRPVPAATNLSMLTKKNLVSGPQLPRDLFGQQASVQIHQRSSSSDFVTKPFIDQLQKKIPDVERDDGNNNRAYESEMPDLTLKL